MQNTTLILHKICPFAERAWITIEEKRIPYSLKQVSLSQKEPWFTETYHQAFGHDPKSDGKVPILVDDGKIITESDLIVIYLAEKYSTGTELNPQDAFEKMKARWFSKTFAKVIGNFYEFKGFKQKSQVEQEKVITKMHENFDELNRSIQLPYALGSDFTVADVMIYPWLARWVAIQAYTNIAIDAKYDKIHQWIANIQERDSVKVTKQSNEFYIEGYRSYFQ